MGFALGWLVSSWPEAAYGLLAGLIDRRGWSCDAAVWMSERGHAIRWKWFVWPQINQSPSSRCFGWFGDGAGVVADPTQSFGRVAVGGDARRCIETIRERLVANLKTQFVDSEGQEERKWQLE